MWERRPLSDLFCVGNWFGGGPSGMRRTAIGITSGAIENAGLPLSAVAVDDEGQTALRIEEQIVELFDTLRLPVYRYLICTHIGPEDADEIIQETFLRLYQQFHRGDRIENARGWIFRVAHNLAVNGMKSRKHITSKTPEEWVNLVESRMDPTPGPEELLLFKEKMSRLHTTISGLSTQQQQCLHLRTEGFRYREIAEILDVGIPTVAESLRRAIEKLTLERHG
jgi:RNA polymerase sigma-70 factor (ECF subfamily)